MTSTHASRPAATLRSVLVGNGRKIHAAMLTTHEDGRVTGYTLCGSEGRTPGSSRLTTVVNAVDCKRCAVEAPRVVEEQSTAEEPEVAEELPAPLAALDAAVAELPAEVAPAAVQYRPVGEGLYEVVLDGVAVGRVARTTPAHVRLSGARWASYTTTGERIFHASLTRADAGDRVVAHARFATVDAATITNRRDLLTAVEVQTRHLGYASAAAYLQAPGREVVRARVEVAAFDPDGPDLPEDGDGHTHLLSDDLLDACGTAGPGGLSLAPSTTPERITCPACRQLALVEQVADAITNARPALPILRPGIDPDRAAAELEARPLTPAEVDTLNAAYLLTLDRLRAAASPAQRLAARYGLPVVQVIEVADEVLDEALTPAEHAHEEWQLAASADGGRYCRACGQHVDEVEPGPEVDDPRDEPRPLEWSSVARA